MSASGVSHILARVDTLEGRRAEIDAELATLKAALRSMLRAGQPVPGWRLVEKWAINGTALRKAHPTIYRTYECEVTRVEFDLTEFANREPELFREFRSVALCREREGTGGTTDAC